MASTSCCGGHICSFVPPYLLKAIADSQSADPTAKQAAGATLAHAHTARALRAARTQPNRAHTSGSSGFIPQYMLRNLADSDQADDASRSSAKSTLDSQTDSQAGAAAAKKKEPTGLTPSRQVNDAQHGMDESALPGKLIMSEGPDAATANVEHGARDCFDNLGRVFDFYAKVFKRNSIDDAGLRLVGTIHFGTDYENAFWDGTQMVFGDGGKFLNNFVNSLDVVGHELTHGVTERTAALVYHTQAGALNESMSDVFGSMIRQYHAKQTSEEADWLIGEDCLLPDIKGMALRSMKAPGTAYNDPVFGKDPQPDHMKNFFKSPDTEEGDWGGVHYNSGIPNRAFYLAAVGLGGSSWEKAGPVWYQALTGDEINNKCTFRQFADITVGLAQSLYGEDESRVVREAWTTVGVLT